MRSLKRWLFGLSPREASFEHRGFAGGAPATRDHLQQVAGSFVVGYQAALESADHDELELRLEGVDEEFRGFATEGAAMYCALLDALLPGGRRFETFARGLGAPHVYMVQVAVGIAMARLPFSPERFLKRLDPVLGWLAMDGYGFHDGFFRTDRAYDQQRVPRRIRGYGRRAYDQGLGRSLWFVAVGDPQKVRQVIDSFPEPRRADLWSGIGLAACYACGIERPVLEQLHELAEGYHSEVAQGAAFGAKARCRAGHVPTATRMACEILTGQSPEEAAEVTDQALTDLAAEAGEPAFEVWRRRIQQRFSTLEVVTPCMQTHLG